VRIFRAPKREERDRCEHEGEHGTRQRRRMFSMATTEPTASCKEGGR